MKRVRKTSLVWTPLTVSVFVGTLLAASALADSTNGPGPSLQITGSDGATPLKKKMIRIGATQPRSRAIDFKLDSAEALAIVDQSLNELEQLVHKAGKAGCDVVVFPEDTLGTLHWEQVNKPDMKQVRPVGV